MARFMGDMQGARGTVSRLGTPQSGLRAHLRGWDFGVQVELYIGPGGVDEIKLIPTGGSGNSSAIGAPIVLKRSDFKGK